MKDIKEGWVWLFQKENHPWIAAVALLILFCKWGFYPSWSRLQLQVARVTEIHRQLNSLQERSPTMPADQVLALLEEWKSEFPFVLNQDLLEKTSPGFRGWSLRLQTDDLLFFLETLEIQLSEVPLPVMYLSITMETGEIELGVGDAD